MKKRVVSFIIAFITMSTTISSIHANTASNGNKDILNLLSYGEWVDSSTLSELLYGTEGSIDFGLGGEWVNPELYSDILTDRHNDNSLDNLRSLPNKYDITEDTSLSQFFPSIGDQGEMNSCTGWASTYYQFTYEVNKLKNEPTNDNNKYSPAWTYNYINGGCNNYANIIDAYRVLKNSGAMKLTDFPCGTDPTTYSYSWSTNDSKMIEALNYRADPYYDYSIGSSDIYAIKNRIHNGQIPVVWTDPLGWFWGYNNDGEVTVVRGSYTGHGHYMCIVGYDDTVQITNNAGVTLYGAFKLVNSKGTSFANDGYIWVSYDALNLQTQHNNWDSSLNTLRTRIFGAYNPNTNQYGNNIFYFIDAKKCTPYFIGKIDYYSNDVWHLGLFANQGTTASSLKWGVSSNYSPTTPTYYSHIFDYADVYGISSMNTCLNDYWTIALARNTTNTTQILYTRIIDNLGGNIAPTNVVFNYMSNDVYSYTQQINLKKGRISVYDHENLTSADASLLQSFILGNTELSNLQMYLADMNDDESVDIFDLVILRQAILSQNNNNNYYDEIMNVYIPEFKCTIEEYILSEYGENGVLYANSLLTNCV